MQNSKNKESKYGLLIAAILTAIGVFAIMTYFQRQALADFEKKEIYVAVSDIPRGTLITGENAALYIAVKSVDAGCVPETALTDYRILNGMSPEYDIDKGTLLTAGMFSDSDNVLSSMTSPVLAGFKTEDLSKAVSGVLRAGDRIDIYSADPETGEEILLCSDVYVECGYDSSGKAVNGDLPAVMFNVYLESEDASSFYGGLRNGYMYVVKRF
ncbi:MAG: hypothetical protein J6X94_11640 [Lachnospiraceae bacterium]|nr:hypothetical protein [Lachnospiraceae bacterium]